MNDNPAAGPDNGNAPMRTEVLTPAPAAIESAALPPPAPAPEPPREAAPAPAEPSPPASYKPGSTYTVWSSTPGEGQHFGPKE